MHFNDMLFVLAGSLLVITVYALPAAFAGVVYTKRRKLSDVTMIVSAVVWLMLASMALSAAWPLAVFMDIRDEIAIPSGFALAAMSIAVSIVAIVATVRYVRSYERPQDLLTKRYLPSSSSMI